MPVKHIFLTGHPAVGKTTIIKNIGEQISHIRNVEICGFYTDERRSKQGPGGRVGFDIVYWGAKANADANADADADTGSNLNSEISSNANVNRFTKSSNWKRVELSTLMKSVKKSDPAVGKYLVNVENVEKYAVASIQVPQTYNGTNANTDKIEQEQEHTTCESSEKIDLVILDEVGKMEMLCPAFIPAVHDLFNIGTNTNTSSNSRQRIILGTIPTPRYGRVIDAVEKIRARDDIIVLHVTKENRNELPTIISRILKDSIESNSIQDGCGLRKMESLDSFLYTRPIGASSMNGRKQGNNNISNRISPKETTNTQPERVDQVATPRPCGPLLLKNLSPKILVLGETASPLPMNDDLSYAERSMWIVFGAMFGVNYRPMKDAKNMTDSSIETFAELRALVLERGICIWDVFADVHLRSVKSKRQKIKHRRHPNDFNDLLDKHPSIELICFIGKKAQMSFSREECICAPRGNRIEYVTLPSSSAANSRMSVAEKAQSWSSAMEKYFPNNT